MRPSDVSADPLLVMESHEIELLECASGLSSAGTNRQDFFFYLQNPSLADKRVLAFDPEQLPSRRGLRRWECPAGAAAAVAAEKKQKNRRLRPLPGSWPPQWMYLAVLGSREAPVSLLSVFRGSLSGVELSGSSDGCWGR